MHIKLINPIFCIQLALLFFPSKALLSESNNYIDKVLEEKENSVYVNYEDIPELILKNHEIKSLQKLEQSARFDLASKIGKKYPSLDLQANGLPKYTAGKNYNSNSLTTKTSQFSANPTLNIRWDLIDPLRGSEIKISRNNYKIY